VPRDEAPETESLSVVSGEHEPALLETTIGDALAHAAQRWPALEAVVSLHQSIRWTYSELDRRVSRVAENLHALGLNPGDRVGIWAPNCAEWVVAQLATARAGLVLVTINPAYRIVELEYTLKKVGIRLLICAERFKASNYLDMVDALRARETSDSEALQWVSQIGGSARAGWIDFSQFYDPLATAERCDRSPGRRAIPANSRIGSRDAVNIQFTSGTTGLPKGATLSHRNILNNGFFVGRAIGMRTGDRLCVPVPLYHCFGMVMATLACITHGATMIFPSPSFDADEVIRAVQQERCTALYGVPTMFIAILEHPQFELFDFSSLRTGIMAGAPCPIEVMRKVIDRMHMNDITIAYGMTETSPVSFQSSVTDSIERRVSTVGRVQPHLECKIIGANGAVVPRGTPGELCTRGYSVMMGYWGESERTLEAIDADGWMHTGDLAVFDSEGYCNIVGRIKDMVIRGGENIYPREIEEFLYLHPKIQDVAVVGVPDHKYGEELCAWIRLKPNTSAEAGEITEFCREQIAHYKIPRYIRFVDAFPLTVTGKVQKFEIRRHMIDELRLAEERTA
jgi:fatty-acyl-CoA synthase